MRSFLSRAVSPMFALALVAFGACADRPDPTQIPAQLEPNALINEDGGGGGDEPDPLTPYISSLSVNNTTLAIGVSSSGSYTAMLRNPGWTRDPVVMATFIRQGTATRAAGTRAVHCGDAPSVLPNGFCTDGGLLSASNTAGGTGTLVPGPASFEVRLKVGTTVVATRSVAVTLIYPPPIVTSVELPDTILATGLYTPFTFTMMNPGPPTQYTNYELSFLDAGGARFGGDVRTRVKCGRFGDSSVPTGTCTDSSGFFGLSRGPFLPGPGTFEIRLITENGLELSRAGFPVVFIPAPSFTGTARGVSPDLRDSLPARPDTGIRLDTLTLGGPGVPFTVFIDNPGPSHSDVVLKAAVFKLNVPHAAGEVTLVLPAGTSTASLVVSAISDPTKPDPLPPGKAALGIDIFDSHGTLMHRATRYVMLVSP
jgi:hypothetical protein